MPRSKQISNRWLVIFVALIVGISFAGFAKTSAQKKKAPKPQAASKAGGANDNAQKPPAQTAGTQRKSITPLRSSESAEGSRVMITSDAPLNDYRAYRSGDRFYVVVPKADAPRAQSGMRGKGFEDVQVGKKDNDAVLSFRVPPGTKPSVQQKFNRLEIVFNTPVDQTTSAATKAEPANNTRPNNGTNPNTANNPNTTTGKQNQTTTLPATANTNPATSANQPNNTAQAGNAANNKNLQAANNGASSITGAATDPNTTGLPPYSTVLPSANVNATPAPSVAPSAVATPPTGEMVAQVGPASTTRPNAVSSTPSATLGATLVRNWPIVLIAALLLLTLGIVAATRSGRRNDADVVNEQVLASERAGAVKESKATKLNEASALETPLAGQTASIIAPVAIATASAEETETKEHAPVAIESEATAETVLPFKRTDTSRPAPFERVGEEAIKLLKGHSYDEAVIGATDAETRQLVAAELLAALAGRKAERRERAREAFIKHNYLDEATYDLRTAEAPAERASAARSLALINDPTSVPHLIAALEDKAPEVRRVVVESLAEMRDSSAAEPLQVLLAREHSRKVPHALIKRAIEACTIQPVEEAALVAPPIHGLEALSAEAATAQDAQAPIAESALEESSIVEAAPSSDASTLDTQTTETPTLETSTSETPTLESPADDLTLETAAPVVAESAGEASESADASHAALTGAALLGGAALVAHEFAEIPVQEEPHAAEKQAADAPASETDAATLKAAAEEAEWQRLLAEEEQERHAQEVHLKVAAVAAEETRQREEAETFRLAAEEALRQREVEAAARSQSAEEETARLRAEETARLEAAAAEAQREAAAEAERQVAEAERQAREQLLVEHQRQADEARQAEERQAEAESARLQAETQAQAESVAAQTSAASEPVIEHGDASAGNEWFDVNVGEMEAESASASTVTENAAALPSETQQTPPASSSIFESNAATTTEEAATDSASLFDAQADSQSSADVAQTREIELVSNSDDYGYDSEVDYGKEIELAANESDRGIELAVNNKGLAPVEDELSSVPNAVLRRLSSEDANERASGVIDLARVGSEDAFREISAAFDDPSMMVRDAAARSLFSLDTDRAASFTRALREATPERRRSIGAALASSGLASEAIGHLTGESREKTYDAFSLLFLMSKAGEVQPLMRAIEEHPNNEVRLAVVKLLALSGQQEILPAFRRLAVRGSLPTEVRSAVMEAIYQISSQATSDTTHVA